MAKFLFVIVCACYCTVCMHSMATALAAASYNSAETNFQMAFNENDNDYRNKPRRTNDANIDAINDSDNNNNNNLKRQMDRRKTIKTHSIVNSLSTDDRYNLNNIVIRAKRHSPTVEHSHSHEDSEGNNNNDHVQINPHSQLFIRKLFQQYGDADKQTMSFEGFEKMLKQLGMDHLVQNYQAQISTIPQKQIEDILIRKNDTCLSADSLITRVFPVKHSQHQTDESQRAMENNKNSLNKSANQSNTTNENNAKPNYVLLKNYTAINNDSTDLNKKNLFLDKIDLLSLCPILLYQLAAPTSIERSGCIKTESLPTLPQEFHSHEHFQYNDHGHDHDPDKDRLWVWIYASLSITIASLCGLLGVAVIPFMERRYYQQMLQFFVALGIGTLAGDALLHLLPHAMLTFSSTENVHASMTWKGLVATFGIIFFFLTERLLTMIAEWRKKIQKRDDPPARVRVMRDMDSVSRRHSLNGEKQCKHKYSSYPYCYDEIALDTKDDHHQHHQHGGAHSHGKENGTKGIITASPPKDVLRAKNIPGEYETAQSLLSSPNHNYTISDGYFKNGDDIEKEEMQSLDNKANDASVESCGCSTRKSMTPENFTIILREHESKHHGHSHTHGHVHSPPKTLSAVAWMVVMGDGLHNFTDGMAIGAAFSNSIAGGFSTAIAVFCHELPHELGDFAVLLKAGMSARKAVYYNILSSVLSLFGMILGIIVGETPEASAWIFACAAGMFIYISLVDMMPELTTAHKEHSALTQCLIQLVGMVIGVCIMLVIALYEDDLRVIFSPNTHHSHGHEH